MDSIEMSQSRRAYDHPNKGVMDGQKRGNIDEREGEGGRW